MEEVSYSMPAAASDSPSSGGGSVEAESCSICLEEFEAGERVQRLVCSHHFHSQVSVRQQLHHHHLSCRQRLVNTAGADPRCVVRCGFRSVSMNGCTIKTCAPTVAARFCPSIQCTWTCSGCVGPPTCKCFQAALYPLASMS